ncbi:family 10 glycosylhydrolase [Candidatus Parcubacteria bacterium]|nr:family 10 glycosylhydrolase [Candidatus Parcubacteria bacterium]
MNKIAFIWILIIIIGLVLVGGLIKEKSIEKLDTPQIEKSKNTTSTFQPMPTFGIYEVCSEIEDCNPEEGIEKIKKTGADSVIVTVVDEDDLKSVSYYPSQYLPLADYVSDNYLKQVVESAHKNNIKVYASINIPHNYWLARHPDWIAVLSDGKAADYYESDYFHRIVPPSRIIAESECKDLLKNIINEIISYGVDGIDINDNFQFSEQYLEENGTTLYSSFDDFTIKKFEKETDIAVQGNSPKKWATYIESHQDIYKNWLKWRAEQVTQLLKILKQNIEDSGVDIPLRPHILTHEDPYVYYGLDYWEIAKEVDVLYVMIAPEQPKEKYFEIIKDCQDTQTKRIAASTYLFKEMGSPELERDEEKILQRMKWIVGAGADELYVYNFRLIEEGNLWMSIKSIFDKIKK